MSPCSNFLYLLIRYGLMTHFARTKGNMGPRHWSRAAHTHTKNSNNQKQSKPIRNHPNSKRLKKQQTSRNKKKKFRTNRIRNANTHGNTRKRTHAAHGSLPFHPLPLPQSSLPFSHLRGAPQLAETGLRSGCATGVTCGCTTNCMKNFSDV